MDENLQFDKADFQNADATLKTDAQAHSRRMSALSCGMCSTYLAQAYYQVNGTIVCAKCSDAIREQMGGQGTRLGRFGRALLYGFGAAVLGSVVYCAIRTITGHEIGLISVFVGILVGNAVRKGSGDQGGWRYQVLAAFLTYVSIASTYIPPAISEYREMQIRRAHPVNAYESDPTLMTPVAASRPALSASSAPLLPSIADKSQTPATAETRSGTSTIVRGAFYALPAPLRIVMALLFLIGLALALPILMGASNLIGILIIGFGVWKAWQLNRPVPPIEITGPHAISV